jgi:hypothetical protein
MKKSKSPPNVGDVIKDTSGRRWLVLPQGALAYVGNSAVPEKWDFGGSAFEATTPPSFVNLGPVGPYMAEVRMHDLIARNLKAEVAFIFSPSQHSSPCHAVLKSEEDQHFGFCGRQPCYGPPRIPQPDGGLCHVCANYVAKDSDGVWRVKAKPTYVSFSRLGPDVDCYGCDDD